MKKELEFNVIFNEEGKNLKDIIIDLIIKKLKMEQHDWQIIYFAI